MIDLNFVSRNIMKQQTWKSHYSSSCSTSCSSDATVPLVGCSVSVPNSTPFSTCCHTYTITLAFLCQGNTSTVTAQPSAFLVAHVLKGEKKESCVSNQVETCAPSQAAVISMVTYRASLSHIRTCFSWVCSLFVPNMLLPLQGFRSLSGGDVHKKCSSSDLDETQIPNLGGKWHQPLSGHPTSVNYSWQNWFKWFQWINVWVWSIFVVLTSSCSDLCLLLFQYLFLLFAAHFLFLHDSPPFRD